MHDTHTGTHNGNTSVGEPHIELRTEWRHRPSDGGIFRLVLRVSAPEVRSPERQRPPLDLAFVIDRSGSMGGGKLELVKQSMAMLLEQLDPNDQVAIVTYAGNAGTALEPTPARQKGRILSVILRNPKCC